MRSLLKRFPGPRGRRIFRSLLDASRHPIVTADRIVTEALQPVVQLPETPKGTIELLARQGPDKRQEAPVGPRSDS